MQTALLLILFLLLLVLGIPIGTALGAAGILIACLGGVPLSMNGLNFVAGIASFPLLAIPFFVLAGVIMERAGIAARIAALFEALVGPMRGGLAVVAVATCMFWGAVSGSGPATTAAVGLILLAPMVRQGYARDFAAATIANASDLSIIIPPSIAFIIYGNMMGVSVGALFMAGIVPGILMGLFIMVTAVILCRRLGYAGQGRRGTAREILRAFGHAFWAFLTPVIILGGIYSGLFTPTEAAVVAVFYSLFLAVIYRSITWRGLLNAFADAAVTSSVILFIVAFAGLFAWAASTLGITDRLAGAVCGIARGPIGFILLVDLLLLILGMFLDAISISYLLLPVFLPVLPRFGIDPIWFGVVFTTALAIGQTTPPVGVNLFTAANLAGTTVDAISRRIMPFIAANVLALLLISLVPAISTWLPILTGLYSP